MVVWLGATPKPGVFLHPSWFGLACLPACSAVTGRVQEGDARKETSDAASAVLGGLRVRDD